MHVFEVTAPKSPFMTFFALLKIEPTDGQSKVKFCNNLATQAPAYSGALLNGPWRSARTQVPVPWALAIIDFISLVAFRMFCLVFLVGLVRCSGETSQALYNLIAEALCAGRMSRH